MAATMGERRQQGAVFGEFDGVEVGGQGLGMLRGKYAAEANGALPFLA